MKLKNLSLLDEGMLYKLLYHAEKLIGQYSLEGNAAMKEMTRGEVFVIKELLGIE